MICAVSRANARPTLTVDLPWPSRALHPNARVHWAIKARAAKKARADPHGKTLAAGIRRIPESGLRVTCIFFPPDNRRRDADGMLSSCRSYFDRIADVIRVDDSRWEIDLQRGQNRKPGSVRIEITELHP